MKSFNRLKIRDSGSMRVSEDMEEVADEGDEEEESINEICLSTFLLCYHVYVFYCCCMLCVLLHSSIYHIMCI